MAEKALIIAFLLASPSLASDMVETSTAKASDDRDPKQLWPILASYYIQSAAARPEATHLLRGSSPSRDSIIIQHPPPTPLFPLSASSLFSKYTKSVPGSGRKKLKYKSHTVGNQHPVEADGLGWREEWNYRVKETSLGGELTAASTASEAAKDSGNSTRRTYQEEEEEEDMALMESVNTLIGSLPASARQNNNYELNGILPSDDVVPLNFPGITPDSIRNRNQSTTQSTSIQEVVNISGVGRPTSVVSMKPEECCLFVFLDGSAYYFDEFMRKVTGFYRVMYGSVNGHPHYVARNCRNPDEYGTSCTYIWYSGYGWVVGVGKYIGQTKGVMFTRNESNCPSGSEGWRYLDQNLQWQDNGNIYIRCAS